MNIDHLNGLIEMMEVMEFTLEIYDSVWCLREIVKAKNKRLLGLNKHLVDAEEDIRAKEGYLEILKEAIYSHDMPIIDEVVFKIYKKGVFEFDPLRNVNGVVYSVFAFTCDRDIFPTCLDWILSKISEEKWDLFYCLPNKQLEHGLKLIHTGNDVHSFFTDAKLNEEDVGLCCYSSSPFTTMIKKKGGNTSRKGKEIRYELPECTPTKDDTLRCSSLTLISSNLKRNSSKKIKEGLRKKGKAVWRTLIDSFDKGKEKVDEFPAATPTKDDTLRCSSLTLISSNLKRNSSKKIKEGLRKKGKAVGRTLIDSFDKGKEKVDEFPAATPTKEHQVVVTNYKRAIVNGKAKMVEVVAHVQENIDVGIKQEDRRRKNVLGSMALANFVKNPMVSASMGQGSSVKVC
ncbi:hypothetical protein Tco_1040104 [Tanacetum coccineum]